MGQSRGTTRRALTLSSIDGALATMMASLAGGLFLTGFAIEVLGASNVQVGILAALPVSANVAQLLGAIWLEKYGHARKLCIWTVTVGRLFWIPVIILALPMFEGLGELRVWLLITLIGMACLFGSLAGVAWLDWMSDVIPAPVRGRYMSVRNMVCAASGMAAVLAGGAFLDRWRESHPDLLVFGFIGLFALGFVLGLLASAFLVRIGSPQGKVQDRDQRFDPAMLGKPFLDSNFRRLVVYVGAFMFVTQMAGPFYAVFMIEALEVPFGKITWFLTAATLASLFMWRIWGPISDRIGNRPMLLVAGSAHAFVPLVWVLARPGDWMIALFAAHILSGAIFSAIQLAHVNILVKLAPSSGRAAYFAMFNGVVGLSTAFAPIFGGMLLGWGEGVSLTFFGFEFGALQLLFLLSGLLQLIILPGLLSVREVGAGSPVAVLMQLRNDLNPESGLASAGDFLLVKKSESENLLRHFDDVTDSWLSRWERGISNALDAVGRIVHGPTRGLRRFLSED